MSPSARLQLDAAAAAFFARCARSRRRLWERSLQQGGWPQCLQQPDPPCTSKPNCASSASSPLPSPSDFQLPQPDTVSVRSCKGHPRIICSWIRARCGKGWKAHLCSQRDHRWLRLAPTYSCPCATPASQPRRSLARGEPGLES